MCWPRRAKSLPPWRPASPNWKSARPLPEQHLSSSALMNALNTETNAHRFTNTAVALHWLAALLIFAAFPLGLYMADLDLSPTKLKLFSYHKWIGITVLLLSILRVLWLRWHPAPPLPGSMPAWQQRAAHGLQHLLYLLLFAIPITGWLMSSAKGFQVVYLGVLPLPDLVG